jgi:hypothetical protein
MARHALLSVGFGSLEQLDAGNRECLNRNAWTNVLEARVVIGDFKHEHNTRHRHSALGYRTPAEYAATCRYQHAPMACDIA